MTTYAKKFKEDPTVKEIASYVIYITYDNSRKQTTI